MRFVLVGLTLTALGVLACTSSERSTERSACSTGPAYSFETDFPSVASSDSSLPECIPRCEYRDPREDSQYPTRWTIAALPSGACSYDGEACQMGAVRTKLCPSGKTSSCSFTGYECRCEQGTWRCYSGAKGASACVCFEPDAGDAG